MQVKKTRGKVYGANLTAAERKAMEMEINRQLSEYSKKYEMEINSIILWELHEQLGFGPKRLKRFYDNFKPVFNDLINRYSIGDTDDSTRLCTYKLKEIGVDIEKWNNER